jgi:hypothetical protein
MLDADLGNSKSVSGKMHSNGVLPYFQTTHQGRGLAIGDLDNDGRPDLILAPR